MRFILIRDMGFETTTEMTVTKILLWSYLFFLTGDIFCQTVNFPFPNHTGYAGNFIQPNNYTQAELDAQTAAFYEEWKAEYLKNDCGSPDEYYVFSGNGAKNVSEAQGYGMMIIAFFAGYDTGAQTYFDGLYHFYKSHPSHINSHLMDWQQVTCNDLPSNDDDAASDGDIDIAFALLLAASQWGSDGAINYLAEAQTIIQAIMQDEINHDTWTVKLGDWCEAGAPDYFFGTRPSDFIADHFRVFSCFDDNWDKVIDTCYALIENMQLNFSPATGLIPDFIVNVSTSPAPAGAGYLEGQNDGDYYYNACRVPWRLGVDYLINGEPRAKAAIDHINAWLLSATDGDVSSISNGYKLDGTPLFDWQDATFTGPFAVGAMLNTSNPSWLNDLYEDLLTNNDLADGDYYSNTLKLLSMIAVSGNYWVPDCSTLITGTSSAWKDRFKLYPNGTNAELSIDWDSRGREATYKITGLDGRVVKEGILSENHNRIDISSCDSGLYLISITAGDRTSTMKIFKE